MADAGTMFLVATPIGNLGDFSPRAAEVLARAALVCVEDTRRTGKLLAHAGVHAARLAVCNEHTEASRIAEVLALLGDGHDVAVVSDAGMPGVSDPGERLVRAAVDAGFAVSAVPGPVAAITALVVSGLPTSRYVFEGFLPRSGRARAARLAELATERRTIVLYEAPHRLARTLADLAAACGGDRRVAVARELTKLFEEVRRSTLAEAADHVARVEPRGEHVIVLAGAPGEEPVSDDDTVRAALRRELDSGADTKTAIATVARHHHVPRREVYALAVAMKGEQR
jgi:16S rRNA (cytidine1402-2'-O)-methyltransferase